MKMDKE
jgi:hypothetical protein